MELDTIVERYVYTVTRQIKETNRDEVGEDLTAHIYELLPPDATPEEAERILREFGNPISIAEEYQNNKKFILSPNSYGIYMKIIKVVCIVILCVVPVAKIFELLADDLLAYGSNYAKIASILISEILISTANALLYAFGMITLLFMLMPKVTGKWIHWPYNGRDWTINDLLIPDAKTVKMSDSVTSIVFTTLFLSVLCFFPSRYLGIVLQSGGEIETIPFFNPSFLQKMIPLILVWGIACIGLDVYILITRRINFVSAIWNMVLNAVSLITFCIILLSENVYNMNFFWYFSDDYATTANQFMCVSKVELGVLALAAILCIVDTITHFVKAARCKYG